MKKVMIAAVAALTLYACDNGDSQKETGSKNNKTEQQNENRDGLMKEVMAIHDEYMPKMDDLHRAEDALQTAIDSLQNEEEPDEELIAEMEKLRDEVEKSGNGMMDWMKGFKKPAEDMNQSEVQKYLEHQKKLMQDVGRKMDESLHKADSALTAK